MNSTEQIDHAINEVFAKYERWANVKYDGEEITLLEHSLQIASLAEENGASDEIILGAFFHDLGHVLEVEQSHQPQTQWKITVGKHNQTGYQYLIDDGFPESVASPALYHVNAKRYLVKREQDYYNGLSETSKRTLIDQGGPMTEEEASQFEALPFCQAITQVRKWDDMAKVIDKETPSLDWYKSLCRKYLIRVSGSVEN